MFDGSVKTTTVYTDEEPKRVLADFNKASLSKDDSDCSCIFGCADFDSHKLAILYRDSAIGPTSGI
jgi:hypothetical protein